MNTSGNIQTAKIYLSPCPYCPKLGTSLVPVCQGHDPITLPQFVPPPLGWGSIPLPVTEERARQIAREEAPKVTMEVSEARLRGIADERMRDYATTYLESKIHEIVSKMIPSATMLGEETAKLVTADRDKHWRAMWAQSEDRVRELAREERQSWSAWADLQRVVRDRALEEAAELVDGAMLVESTKRIAERIRALKTKHAGVAQRQSLEVEADSLTSKDAGSSPAPGSSSPAQENDTMQWREPAQPSAEKPCPGCKALRQIAAECEQHKKDLFNVRQDLLREGVERDAARKERDQALAKCNELRGNLDAVWKESDKSKATLRATIAELTEGRAKADAEYKAMHERATKAEKALEAERLLVEALKESRNMALEDAAVEVESQTHQYADTDRHGWCTPLRDAARAIRDMKRPPIALRDGQESERPSGGAPAPQPQPADRSLSDCLVTRADLLERLYELCRATQEDRMDDLSPAVQDALFRDIDRLVDEIDSITEKGTA